MVLFMSDYRKQIDIVEKAKFCGFGTDFGSILWFKLHLHQENDNFHKKIWKNMHFSRSSV